MKRLSAAIVYFLIALCFSGNMAKAQELTQVPAQIQGNWALPDCGFYDEALLFTRYFYLKSTREGISLRPAGLERQAEDYMILSLDGTVAPAQTENDGILSLATLEKLPAKRTRNWPRLWEKLPVEQTLQYAACDHVPDVVPANMARLMRYADRLREACSITGDQNCARVIFKFADNDNNQKVGMPEIISATHSLMIFAELGAAKKPLGKDDLQKIKNRAAQEGAKIADDLLARYDTNKSGDLDYNEMVDDVTPPALPIMREMLEKAAPLMPQLGIVAIALPADNKPARRHY